MKSKILRSAGLILATLMLLAGAALYLLNNEAFVSNQLSKQLFNATGWQLQIQGDFAIEWGEQTRLVAKEISLLNPQWSDNPQMFNAASLQLVLQPLKLWDRQLIIDELLLTDCSAHYLENSDGSNWRPAGKPAAEPGADDVPANKKFSWRVQNLDLTHCQFGIHRRQHEKMVLVEVQKAQLKTSTDNTLSVNIHGAVDERVLTLEGSLSPLEALWQGGLLQHELKLQAGENILHSSGTFNDFRNGDGANLQLRFSGPEFSEITKLLAWPALSSGPFDARLSLVEGATGLTGLQLDGDFGSLKMHASGQLDRIIEPEHGTVDLQASGPDLAAMGRLLGQAWLIPLPFNLSLKADIQQGKTELQSATLQTGEDRISASGMLGPWSTWAGTDVKAQLHVAELTPWQPNSIQWLTLFGPLDANLDLTINENAELQADLHGLLSSNHFSIQSNLMKRSAWSRPGLSVEVESASLQQFARLFNQQGWPDQAFQLKGDLHLEENLVQLNQLQLEMAGDTLDMSGKVMFVEALQGNEFTAQLKLADLAATGSRFGLADLPSHPLDLSSDLQWHGKSLKFDIHDGALSDIRIRMKGEVPDIQHPLAMTSLIDLNLPSAKMVGFLWPEIRLPDLPFTAKGEMVNSDSITRLKDFSIRLGQNQANLDVDWKLAKDHVGSMASLYVNGENIRDLWPEAPPELTLGPFEWKAKWLRKADGHYVEASELDLGLAKLVADGLVASTIEQGAFNLNLKLSGNDASQLNGYTGQPFKAEPFALQFQLKGKGKYLEFENVNLKLGQSDLLGQLQLDLRSRPLLSGSLTSTRLDLSPWQQEFIRNSQESKQQAGQQQAGKKSDSRVFTDQPFTLVQDVPVDTDLDLQLDEVVLHEGSFYQLKLGLQMSPDNLRLQPFDLQGFNGGHYNGSLNSQRSDSLSTLDFQMQAEDMKFGQFALFDVDPAKLPSSDVFLKLSGKGNTWHDMAQSLNGKLRWYQGSGLLSTKGLNFVFSDFLSELLDTLNPLSKKSEYAELKCAVYAADIVNGMVTVEPVVFQTDQVSGLSDGHIDLSTEAIDLSFHIAPRKGLGISAASVVNPFFKIGGTLKKPALQLDVAKGAISGGAMVATVGLSVLFKSVSDRWLSSKDPCGDARRTIEENDSASGKQ